MNAPEFSGVVESFRPLLWALAVVIIILAVVCGAKQLLAATLPKKDSGTEPFSG